ncbi:trypsin-like serine peptidase [Patescibacteria group bacterium]
MSEKRIIDYDEQQLTLFAEAIRLAEEDEQVDQPYVDERQLDLFSEQVKATLHADEDLPPSVNDNSIHVKRRPEPSTPSRVMGNIWRKIGKVLVIAAIAGAALLARNYKIDHENDKMKEYVKGEVKKKAIEYFQRKLINSINKLKAIQQEKNLLRYFGQVDIRRQSSPLISKGKHGLNYQMTLGCIPASTFQVTKDSEGSNETEQIDLDCFEGDAFNTICINENRIIVRLKYSDLSSYADRVKFDGEGDLDVSENEYWMIDIIRDEDGSIKSLKFAPLFYAKGNEKRKGFEIPITDLSFSVTDKETIKLLEQFIEEKAKYVKYLETLKLAKKSNERKGLEDSVEFYKKIQRGIVQFKTNNGLCTGFIYDERTIVTAEHCLKGFKYVTSVLGLKPNGSRTYPKYKIVRGSRKCKTASDKSHDYGVIVFDKPILDARKALKISQDPIDKGIYYYLHFLRYNRWHWGTKWKIDKAPITEYKGSKEDGLFHLDTCEVIGGNSGTPVVNHKGEVVSVINTTWSNRRTGKCLYNEGAWITEKNIQELIKDSRE